VVAAQKSLKNLRALYLTAMHAIAALPPAPPQGTNAIKKDLPGTTGAGGPYCSRFPR